MGWFRHKMIKSTKFYIVIITFTLLTTGTLIFISSCKHGNINSQIKEMGFISPDSHLFPRWKRHFKLRFDPNKIKKGIYTIWDKRKGLKNAGQTFLITKDGYMLTTLHNIKSCYNPKRPLPQDCPSNILSVWIKTDEMENFQIGIRQPLVRYYSFSIIRVGYYGRNTKSTSKSRSCSTVSDDSFDAALIKVDQYISKAKPLKIRKHLPSIPVRVFTMSKPIDKYSSKILGRSNKIYRYPVSNSKTGSFTLSTGKLSRVTARKNLISSNRFGKNQALDVFVGNSGGPLLLSDGTVVGIHYSDTKLYKNNCRTTIIGPSHHVQNVSTARVIEQFNL